jgi:phosphatidylethanolamine-binding protein (PEBP) family uncharacterized protein
MRRFIFPLLAAFLILSCKKETTQTNPSPVGLPLQTKFTGNGFVHNGTYPKLYTCDSTGISPGLQWSNAPATTRSYAITMHTVPPTGGKHVYIVLYNIPSNATSMPDNSKTLGNWGINTVDGKNSYSPPCSQGPGAKVYVLTLYALTGEPNLSFVNPKVTLDMMYEAVKTKIADSAVMSVTYTRF